MSVAGSAGSLLILASEVQHELAVEFSWARHHKAADSNEGNLSLRKASIGLA